MNKRLAAWLAWVLFTNTVCGQDALVDRSPEKAFPGDCISLSVEDDALANALLDQAMNRQHRSIALRMIETRIKSNGFKAYAWWRWVQLAIRNRDLDSDLELHLRSLPTLRCDKEEVRFELEPGYCFFYVLKDGAKIAHGPCLLFEKDTGELSYGEFWHGVRHGIWKNKNINYPEKGESKAEWKFGKPMTGTFLLTAPDRAYYSVKLLNGLKIDDNKLVEFTYPIKVVNLGKDDGLLKQLKEGEPVPAQAIVDPPKEPEAREK